LNEILVAVTQQKFPKVVSAVVFIGPKRSGLDARDREAEALFYLAKASSDSFRR
jgi:hypothetical protein